LIFAKVAEKSETNPVDDLLDLHSRSFILLAARTLMLDILMLEALLVVDELPTSNIIHFETEMVESSKKGLIQDPAWGTRPIDIPDAKWRLLQDNLYPNLISIVMLDGIKDDLEFRIIIEDEMNHNFMYSTESVKIPNSLVDYQYLWVCAGIGLVILGITIENKRRNKAKQILQKFASENKWN
jgi:hypothetical protein